MARSDGIVSKKYGIQAGAVYLLKTAWNRYNPKLKKHVDHNCFVFVRQVGALRRTQRTGQRPILVIFRFIPEDPLGVFEVGQRIALDYLCRILRERRYQKVSARFHSRLPNVRRNLTINVLSRQTQAP